MTAKLSVCMIVKNEAGNIARCLGSVKDIADEIIVIDTGSTDNTKAIAKKYGAKVYDFEWVDNFSKARNYSLEKATGDWILILDGDDEFEREDSEKLHRLINSEDAADIYVFKTVCYVGDSPSHDRIMNINIRLFKNKPEFRYQGRIHEGLIPVKDTITGAHDITIYHYGYLNPNVKEQNKRGRNIRILEEQLKEDPDSPYFKFCMGNEYYALEQPVKALEYFLQSYRNCQLTDVYRPKLVVRIIMCYQCINQPNEALKYIEEALRDYPQYTDVEFIRGDIYYRMGKVTKAIKSFERCLEMGEPSPLLNFIVGVGTYRPHFALGNIYKDMEEYDKAIQCYNQVLLIKNDFHDAIHKIGEIYAKTCSNPEDIKKGIEQFFVADCALSYANIARILFLQKKYELALEYIERTAAYGANFDDLNFLKARSMLFLKIYEEAVKEFEKINAGSSYYLDSQVSICICCLIQNRFEDAKGILENIKIDENREKDYKVLYCLCNLFESGEKTVLSEDVCESKAYLAIIINMMDILLYLKEFAKFEKALELLNCIESDEVLLALAKLYNSYGYFQMATKEIKRSIKTFDRLDEETAYILYRGFMLPDTNKGGV